MIRKCFSIQGLLFIILLLAGPSAIAQQDRSVHWIGFEQLEDSLDAKPKKVFIDFYTDWCDYCRKMDKVVFTKPEVIDLLNEQYYAVRLNAETESVIAFEGQKFVNDQVGKSRSPIHQIAQLLALRNGRFAPPTLVVLDEDFNVKARYFEYMDSKRLIKALQP